MGVRVVYEFDRALSTKGTRIVEFPSFPGLVQVYQTVPYKLREEGNMDIDIDKIISAKDTEDQTTSNRIKDIDTQIKLLVNERNGLNEKLIKNQGIRETLIQLKESN